MAAGSEPLEVVGRLFEPLLDDGTVDLMLIRDWESPAPVAEVIAPDAEVRFELPGGGFMGPMGGPFVGPRGFLDGWQEWLDPWDDFHVEASELVESGPGQVLMLGLAHARLKGADASITQPVGVVYTVRGTWIVKVRHFLDHDQARAAAGRP